MKRFEGMPELQAIEGEIERLEAEHRERRATDPVYAARAARMDRQVKGAVEAFEVEAAVDRAIAARVEANQRAKAAKGPH